MIVNRTIPGLLLTFAVAIIHAATLHPEVITARQIVAAVSLAGIDVDPTQVRFFTDVVAITSDPELRVRSIERRDKDQIRLRMDCVKTDECVPFFVAVPWNQENAVPTLPPRPQVQPSADTQPRRGASPFSVLSGSEAILQLEGDHIHIQVSVICLENGSSGQAIYATSKDRRQTYRAQVVGSGRLRGAL